MAATIKTELEFKDKGVEAGFRAVAAEVRQYRESIETKLGPSQEALVRRSREQTAAMKDATQATRGGGQGMLQLAHFADDAQYGIRGVLNNIPGLVMGLGAGAGLAGVISLVVLAAAKLGPLLAEIYSNKDSAGAIEGMKRYGVVLAQNLKTLKEHGAERERQARMGALTGTIEAGVQSGTSTDQRADTLERQMELIRKVREEEDKIAQARGEDAAATARRNAERIAADQKMYAELARLRSEEADAAKADAERFGASFTQNIEQAAAEAERLRKNKASADANYAQAQAEFDAVKDKGYTKRKLETDNLEKTKERAEADAAALADQEAILEVLKKQQEATQAMIEARQRAASAASTEATARAQELERQKKSAAEMVEIAKQEAAEKERIAQAEKAATEEKKRQAEAVDAARKAVTAAQAEQEYAMVTKIAELRKAGNKDAADALQKEMNIRRDAASLESQGVDRARAMAMARARATAQEAQAAGVPGGGSRRFLPERIGGLRDTTPFGGGGRERFLPVRIGGLRTEAQRTEQAANRAAAARTNPHEDAAMKYYESSLQKQAELVEIFKNLGAI